MCVYVKLSDLNITSLFIKVHNNDNNGVILKHIARENRVVNNVSDMRKVSV